MTRMTDEDLDALEQLKDAALLAQRQAALDALLPRFTALRLEVDGSIVDDLVSALLGALEGNPE